MLKPNSLRKYLTSAIPALESDPDKLLLIVDEGAVVSTGAPSLSFMWQYTLNVSVEDFTQDPNVVMVPLLAWVREQQPDLLFNPDRRDTGITFQADLINHETVDLLIKLKLTESVCVAESNGTLQVTTLTEPDNPSLEVYDVKNWELKLGDEVVATWTKP